MQITIVVDDKLVLVDRKPLELDLDWSAFDMDPNDPNDDVSAVQFDTDAGQGHVEFKTRLTKQATRPNVRPPDWRITSAEFEKYFAFVLPIYEAKMKKVKAEEAARDAEVTTAINEQALSAPAQAPELPPNLVTKEEMDAAVRAAVADFAQKLAAETGGV